jgi:hypothetical protein
LVFLPSQYVLAPLASAQIPTPVVEEVTEQVIPEPEPIAEVKPVPTNTTLCNCFTLIKRTFKDVPRMAEIQKTAGTAFGNVAVFSYHGVPHVAVVTGQGIGTFTIREWNYKKCKETVRDIKFDDKNLKGFVTLK